MKTWSTVPEILFTTICRLFTFSNEDYRRLVLPLPRQNAWCWEKLFQPDISAGCGEGLILRPLGLSSRTAEALPPNFQLESITNRLMNLFFSQDGCTCCVTIHSGIQQARAKWQTRRLIEKMNCKRKLCNISCRIFRRNKHHECT